jgi:hypothetical protein
VLFLQSIYCGLNTTVGTHIRYRQVKYRNYLIGRRWYSIRSCFFVLVKQSKRSEVKYVRRILFLNNISMGSGNLLLNIRPKIYYRWFLRNSAGQFLFRCWLRKTEAVTTPADVISQAIGFSDYQNF